MKHYRYILAGLGVLACLNMFALRQAPDPVPNPAREAQQQSQQEQNTEKTIIDIKGRRMFPIDVGIDTTAVSLVGQVIAYHNGSVITCDSAVRYSDRRIECFGNVIINKDTTYVYGDRVDYDGDRNLARVYSPLIKMVDGDAVLYTYNFIFNTLENIGEYFGGGTVTKGETLLESDRGYYYADTKDVVCVGNAELRDTAYLIISDSLGFNMESEIATFYTKTYIWNEKGEILSANKGWYYTKEEHYHFVEDAYILTEDQEVWADDINYWSEVEDAVLRRNIQIRDEEQQLLSFGDYGLYFGESGNAMLTENPSLISFKDENGDSLYMRSDTMFMFMIDSTSIYSPDYIGNKKEAETGAPTEERIDPLTGAAVRGQQAQIGERMKGMQNDTAQGQSPDSTAGGYGAVPGGMVPDSLLQGGSPGSRHTTFGLPADSLAASGFPADSLGSAGLPADSLAAAGGAGQPGQESVVAAPPQPTKKELKQQEKELKQKEKELKRQEKEKKQQEKAARSLAKEEAKRARKKQSKDLAPDADADANAAADGDVIPDTDDALPDDADGAPAEGETGDAAEEAPEEEEKEKDRVLVGYHNVRIWREDFQAVCDSLIGFSMDTTLHLHIEPVMWNGENQIASDLAVVYVTPEEEIDKAVFTGGKTGNPIMSSKLDDWHYNQVTGKVIEALFTENEIYRTDAIGNGQTYYYLQDEDTHEYQGFLVAECSDITFNIVDREVVTIVYRGNPVYAIYPMNKIPDAQERTLPNFKWQGSRRPELIDVFDRVIKPSRREEYEALPMPQFPLTLKIDTYKASLIESGTWRDRDEDISREAYEFMRQIESRQPAAQ